MLSTIAKADASKLTEIEQLAERLEPALARAVRDMLTDYAESVDLEELEAAVRSGMADRVLAVIGSVDEVKAGAVRAALENAVWAGGALGAQSPVLNEAKFVFNRLNPALLQWLEGYELNLIREVNKGTVEAIRAELYRGMQAGANPIDQARNIKSVVGLTQRQVASVAAYRKELETFHLKRSAAGWGLGNERSKQSGLEVYALDRSGQPKDGILERRLRDQRYDATLQRTLTTRQPLKPEQIARMVAAYQRRFLQHRARTIARTESLRATAVGVHEAWRQAIASGKVNGALVRKLWILSKDERLCPVCSSIPKANPKRGVPIDRPFIVPGADPVMLPPQHPNCRCSPFFRVYERSQLEEP